MKNKLMCACCKREPENITSLVAYAKAENMNPVEFVEEMEGTYVQDRNEFVCDDCYTKVGAPSVKATDIKNRDEHIKAKEEVLEECMRRYQRMK